MPKIIVKRDGREETWSVDRVAKAILKSLQASGVKDPLLAKRLAKKVEDKLVADKVEQETVQDTVEQVLMESRLFPVAKKYILYRDKRRAIRGGNELYLDIKDTIDSYLDKTDWRVAENSNMAHSFQGLMLHMSGAVQARYTLEKYSEEIRNAHNHGYFHIHDLSLSLVGYCSGWSLRDLLLEGFNLEGKCSSGPAKHFDAVLGQMVNFLGTLQNEWAGAQAYNNCFSFDTEVLTDHGWKYFNECDMDTKFATLNTETMKLEYQLPNHLHEYDYNGKMHHYKSNLIDTMVTPDHNMLVQARKSKLIKHIKSSDLTFGENDRCYNRTIPRGSNEEFVNTGLMYTTKDGKYTFEMDDWMRFLGTYLSEGSCYFDGKYRARVYISKPEGKECRRIAIDFLEKYKIPYSTDERNVYVYGKSIYNEVFFLGTASKKFIPKEFKDLPPYYLRALIDTLYRCDGYFLEKSTPLYFTVSTALRDDLMEILVKCGMHSSCGVFNKKGNCSYYKGREIRANYDLWYISIINDDRNLILWKPKEIEYDGKVYCASVPNRTLMVRRNGKMHWCGNCDTYLAPFVRHDNLSYTQLKQDIQKFVYNLNTSSRWGGQTPFSNLTFDMVCPKHIANEPVIMGGKLTDDLYGDFNKEMEMINKAFLEVMLEGDYHGRIFSFPIPTYNVTTDFPWDSEVGELLLKLTAKYGVPYFQNFINSDLNPEDVRSMCCRLQMDLRELKKRTGGLFGAGDLTGSVGVVTLNLPKLAYLAQSEEDFLDLITEYATLAKDSLEFKRKMVSDNLERNMMPFSKRYLKNGFRGHFSTIGLVGGHEACLNLIGKGIETESGLRLMTRVLDHLRELTKDFQEETGNLYNLEATPAEGTSYRLAKIDKKLYSDIKTSGTDEVPYYTNSTLLPVGFTEDIFNALEHQNNLQPLYTGGTVFHSFLGEAAPNTKSLKEFIIKALTVTKIPYISITPTFSVCKEHGYLQGEQFTCPTCGAETEVYTRVVGYYRPVKLWNKGKQAEYKDRLEYSHDSTFKS